MLDTKTPILWRNGTFFGYPVREVVVLTSTLTYEKS
jgi:hypothetical protein